MEDLLLVLDEIDDLFAMVGSIWRPVASFLLAVAAFVATGFLFLRVPLLLAFLAATLISLGVLDELRNRRQLSRPKPVDA